jgi:Lrp/AsnC family transcriptional regulator, leucine-responsive regulatory protein
MTAKSPDRRKRWHDASASDVLDPVDNRIVAELVRDGRASYADLGRAVGLSAHAVGERVRRLVREGAITGFTAKVDLATVGRSLEALIDIRLLPTTSPDAFEKEARALQAVREITFVTGRFDYQLRVACQDTQDLDDTVRALRQRAGVAVTETRIVLRSEAPLGRD